MESTPVLRFKKPLILKKKNMTILNSNKSMQNNVSFIREEIIHDTTDVYFLKGEFQRMILVNRLNLVNKSSRTVAKYFTKDGSVLEKNSDKVTQVIGQEPYKTIFTALCSIIDQELKVRSILALLTVKTTDLKLEGDRNGTVHKESMEKSCQTDEMRILPLKCKPRRRIRKQVSPYIVQDLPEKKKIKKLVVNFSNNLTECKSENSTVSSETDSITFQTLNNSNKDNCSVTSETLSDNKLDTMKNIQHKRNSTESLIDLGYLHDEYSNDSTGKFSTLSETPTLVDLYTNPTAIFNNVVDQHTKDDYVQDYIVQPTFRIPDTDIYVPCKPEDMFHLVTKENYQYLDKDSRKKLLAHQMNIYSKYCLKVMDEDGNFPIHLAVLNNDLELLIRQCIVLKLQGSSVDILANGLTPLKLSMYQEAPHNSTLALCLLRHGADPLQVDSDHRACVHIAAEKDPDLFKLVLTTCRINARKILSESDELWKPEMEKQTDEELATYLMKHMCSMFDKSGYTPLMLASMLGLYENVRTLLEHSPSSVNDRMPTSGNTALYLAVAAASNCSAERGDKSKVVDHFRKTIEILLENGANPTIENDTGSNVNTLLQDFNCTELSMIVANKVTQANFPKKEITAKECDKVMLVMDGQGNIEYKAIENDKKNKSNKNAKTIDSKKNAQSKNEKNKPVIVENILLKSLDKIAKKSNSAGKSSKNNEIVDTSTKIDDTLESQQIVLTGINENTLKKVEKKNVLILPKPPLTEGKLKRKILAASKAIKQTKTDK